MTAKQEFWQACYPYEHGDDQYPIWKRKTAWEAFLSAHRSVQTRKVGKNTVQIRFNDNDSWTNIEEWPSEYERKTIKNLHDHLTQEAQCFSLTWLLPEALGNEAWKEIQVEALKVAASKNQIMFRKDYEEKLASYNQQISALRDEISDLETKNSQLSCEVQNTRGRIKTALYNLENDVVNSLNRRKYEAAIEPLTSCFK